MRNTLDLSGQRFGKLLVVSFAHSLDGIRYYNCLCDCGNTSVVPTNNLRSGNSTSCGCYNAGRLSPGASSAKRVYNEYIRGADKRGLTFDISFEVFLEITGQRCYYCGSGPRSRTLVGRSNGPYVYNGIDRVDNNVGYIIENCVPCCKICNRAKREMSKVDYEKWIDDMVAHRSQREHIDRSRNPISEKFYIDFSKSLQEVA